MSRLYHEQNIANRRGKANGGISPVPLSILVGIIVEQRVSGSTPVQLNLNLLRSPLQADFRLGGLGLFYGH